MKKTIFTLIIAILVVVAFLIVPITVSADELSDNINNQLENLDLEELPGPIAKTQDELEENLENLSKMQEKYKEKYKKFNNKFNYLDDKDATKRVIKKIFNS